MLNEPLCRGCNIALSADQDSEAHLIPSALGGRLAPRGILCRLGNGALNILADLPLIKAFGPWPTLLDIPRDRGANHPVILETTDGHKIRQKADGSRRRIDHVYDVSSIAQGDAVEIITPDWKQMRQRIAQAAKQFPQLDPAVAEAHAIEMRDVPSGLERVSVNFAPSEVFPGVMTALWLFGIYKTGHELMPWARLIDMLIKIRQDGCFDRFRYLPGGLPGLEGPEIPISHKIVLRTVPSAGLLVGYVEVLGALRVGGILAEIQPPSRLEEYIYVADVFGKIDRSAEFTVDGATFDNTNWRSVGLGLTDAPSGALRQYVIDSQAPLIERKKQRDAAIGSGADAQIETPNQQEP